MPNSLILATTPLWTVHHAESIELAHRLKDTGRNLYVTCTGALHSCPANPSNDQRECQRCRGQTQHTRNHLLPVNFDFISLDFTKNSNFNEKYNLKSLSELLGIYYHDMPIGRLVASQIFGDEKGEYIEISKLLIKINTLIRDGIFLYNFITELIQKHEVTTVYAWNGRRQSDGPALWAAKKLNIEYYSYISGGEVGKIFILDATSVQDFSCRQKYKESFILKAPQSRSEIYKDANSYFKQYKDGSLRQVGYRFSSAVNSQSFLPRGNKPILLIAMSSPKEHVHQASYHEFFGDDPYGNTLKFLDSIEIFEKFEVIVRWHPFNARSNTKTKIRIQELIQLYARALHFPPESNIDTYQIMNYATVCYGTGSTVLQYASFIGKPVLIFGPSAVMFEESVFSLNTSEDTVSCLMSDSFRSPKDKWGVIKLAFYSMHFGDKFQHIDTVSWRLVESGVRVCPISVARSIRSFLSKLLPRSIKLLIAKFV